MSSLAVYHNIHLTREQRYSLHDGESIEVIGVSVPVWFTEHISTEPAREIFCKYKLSNRKQVSPINILDDGYEISIPYRKDINKPDINTEQWFLLRQVDLPELERMYSAWRAEISSKLLLDIKDGGSAYLSFRENNKLKRNEEIINVMHYVEIHDIKALTDSIEI